jgi:hypothetical protein
VKFAYKKWDGLLFLEQRKEWSFAKSRPNLRGKCPRKLRS